jgi:hypothetical protein
VGLLTAPPNELGLYAGFMGVSTKVLGDAGNGSA